MKQGTLRAASRAWLAAGLVWIAAMLASVEVAAETPGAGSAGGSGPDTSGSAAPGSPSPPASAAAADAPPPEVLARAKELFRSGVALFNAGDMERALDYFLRSRAAYPSSKNTVNAAICLDRLGRYDEALELYEEVLTRFSAELDEESRAAIAPAMTALRGKVGSVNLSANVDGSVLVDGHARGKLPLTGPLRVLGGKHVVRVLKDGYAAAEATIAVDVGKAVSVDLRLPALAAAGVLRVEDPSNAGAAVFVDRVAVGTAPWEGTLGPGKHLVWVAQGDLGTAPAEATVVQGQTVLVRLKSSALGPSAKLEAVPTTAQMSLDGVALGAGSFVGRLPVGPHVLTAQEPGYFSKTVRFSAPPPGGDPVKQRVVLGIDRSHPRWPKAGPSGKLWAGAFGGYAWSPSLGGAASDACPDRCRGTKDHARGFAVGARAGYRFPFGVSLELTGGYLSLVAAFSRYETVTASNPPVRYYIDDDIGFVGPLVTVGASYRLRLSKHLSATGRVGGGVMFVRSIDVLSATGATTNGSLASMNVVGAGDAVRSIAVIVTPEIAAGYSFGAVEVGVALSSVVVVNSGPDLRNGNLQVDQTSAPCVTAGTLACAPTSGVVANERAYGSGLFALSPQLTATYTF